MGCDEGQLENRGDGQSWHAWQELHIDEPRPAVQVIVILAVEVAEATPDHTYSGPTFDGIGFCD